MSEVIVEHGPGFEVTVDDPDGEVRCWAPEQDERDEPPEEYGAWRTESGFCRHGYCVEAESYARMYRKVPPQPTLAEIAETNADLELMWDETHGRGFER